MNNLISKYSVDLPDLKRLKKHTSDEEPEVFNFEDYDIFKNTNFKLSQLRTMCKYFNLKVSGNKKVLTTSLYNYLRLSFYSIHLLEPKRPRAFLPLLMLMVHASFLLLDILPHEHKLIP